MPLPFKSIIQLAYVSRADLFDECLAYWTNVVGVGPFFVGDFELENQLLRGKRTECTITAAIGYRGDQQIEVIRPTNDAPSIYRETIEEHPRQPAGGHFHHYMFEPIDYDAAIAHFMAHGCRDGYSGVMADKKRLTYLDGRDTMGCYVEMIEPGGAFAEMCRRMRAATATWDGRNPVRTFGELVKGIPGFSS